MSAYAALTRANYRAAVRDRTTVFFTFAFPLLFLIVFGLIFKGQTVQDDGPRTSTTSPPACCRGASATRRCSAWPSR